MTGRVGRAADTKERRRASGQRVHFEAMVAVGGAEGGAAFEAESVDVSSEGMRLRTAYLPSVGDRLVCRFDGSGTEVVAVGEVLWATEQSKGGEFGLKFVDLDTETEQALRELCFYEAQAEPAEREEPAKPKVAKNARVKLHIEGLASPMKARVRDGDDKEVCVGSSLEFLKLGRQVEVEDVDVGDRREGFVDAVKVEVDPNTSIPQLVVSLRFDAAAIGAGPKTVSVPKGADAEIEAAPVTKVVPSKRVEDAPKAPKSVKKTASMPPPAPEAQAKDAGAEESEDDDDDAMMQPNKLRAAQEKAKDLTSKAAAKIGPAFTRMGDGAKGIWSTIRGTIDKRREARDEARKANAPRRVTAPPPSGALTSEGRRVVRQDQGKDEEEGSPLSVSPKRSKKGIVIGAAAGLALVIGVVGVTKAIGSKGDEKGSTHAAAAERKNETLAMPPIPGAAASVNMPMYGATQMSTIGEVVPTPPAADAKGEKGEVADKGDAAESGEEKSEMVREWGHGEVHSGKPFTVRMDGPIEGFVGSEEEDGFSITVPKTRSKSTGSALVRKDPRLSAVDVVNREDGSEIHVKFKGEPPPYKVKVRGDKLEIAFGKSGSGKAESKKGETKKVAQKSDKKKSGKGDKKKAGNKAHAGHK